MPAQPQSGVRTSADLVASRALQGRAEALRDPVLRWVAGAGAAWLAGYALLTRFGGDSPGGQTALACLYLLGVTLAAVVTVVAAVRADGRSRWFWGLLASSQLLWLAGEVTWVSLEFRDDGEVPFPSLADAFYLGCYVMVLPAVAIGLGVGFLRVFRSLLDASAISAAVGLLGYQLLVQPQLVDGPALSTSVGIAYPLLGVATIVVVGVLGYGSHRPVPLAVGVVAVAMVVRASTDVAYTHAVVLHTYLPGGYMDLGWQASAVLLLLGATVAARHPQSHSTTGTGRRDGALPLLLAGAVTTALVTAKDAWNGDVSLGTLALALYTLTVVVGRLVLTVHEKDVTAQRLRTALEEQERLAITDGLTGLHNRRFVEEVLRLEVQRRGRTGRPLSVVVLDADHFKRVNDGFGHPVGDAVLQEVARRLLSCVRPSDVVARYGGEEFVVLLPETDSVAATDMAERCRVAVRGAPVEVDGRSVAVTVSLGVATVPEHAQDVDGLLRVADQSLYLAKRLGRDQVQVGAPDTVQAEDSPVSEVVASLCAVVDRLDQLQDPCVRSVAIAGWARAVAAEMGLDERSQQDCYWAGRLHDLGELAPSEELLAPLGEEGPGTLQRQLATGTHLLRLRPETVRLAQIVAEHHERADGKGSPAGLVPAAVSIEARVVAVCASFAALQGDRRSRPGCSPADARAALVTGSGGTWDAAVVQTFVTLLDRGLLEPPRQGSGPDLTPERAPVAAALDQVPAPRTATACSRCQAGPQTALDR